MKYTEQQTANANDLNDAVGDLTYGAARVSEMATEDLTALSIPELATLLARIQDMGALCRAAEQHLAASLGERHGAGVMDLLDGRQATLKRTAERKEWDHEDWKRDVRRAVTREMTDYVNLEGTLVDTTTGEEVSLGMFAQEVATRIQMVHGSAEPKSTALKPLGLYKGDYCTSSPAGWRLTTLRAEPVAADATTTKD